ncbi:nectin-1-like isoform X2 [Brienomyrus brachyistius]|uniref:nectin-1-like isoform X2 n=1 Tax=Brienomyrus brachyistius TaxID=42636 RepID=UPI0020B372BA|nr:nectin-1-like isoform X2 [Brienomyrus brachyistius]
MTMAVPTTLWIYLMAVYISGSNCQMVQMDATKSGYVGSQVELRCLFMNIPGVKISQVTWQKFLNGSKQNVAIVNPTMGVSVLNPFKERVTFKLQAVQEKTPSLEDTTIVFSNLQLSDEAAYICEYTTFPAGNRENMVNLTVFARPEIQMIQSAPTIVAQSSSLKVSVATCLAANGKPPGVITWETTLKGEERTEEIPHSNGTVTVRSDYFVIPSREMHKQKLTCIVTYNNDTTKDTIILNVQYNPVVKIEGFDGNWYLNRQDKLGLTCTTEANPPVTHFEWRLLNGSMPAGVEIRNNTLSFKGPVTNDLTGTYVCEATNSIGTRSGQVEVNVTEKPLPQGVSGETIGIVGGVVAAGLIAGVAVVVFLVYRRQQKTRTERDNELTDLPPAHKLVPPLRRNTDFKGHLTSDDIQVFHPDKEVEEMREVDLHPPYYDMASSFSDKLDSDPKDHDVQYAELDTSVLASSPCPRSSILSGDLVEYATIQPSL